VDFKAGQFNFNFSRKVCFRNLKLGDHFLGKHKELLRITAFKPFPLSRVGKARRHNVLETWSVSVLR
jgi:hypothetical protein